MENAKIFSTRRIAISGIVMAIYISLMYFTQWFAFGQYQIRIATALYSLSALAPYLIIPLGLGNMISNTLTGGMGIYDILGGFLVGVITSTCTYLIGRANLNRWFLIIPLICGPGLIVPIWLSKILNINYTILAASLCIGQVLPAIMGVILINQVQNKIRF
ncbi:QueT transporter family protein [Clostridium sp. JN-1]|uniref:QueT transporter family protein n=1 Tax=Clostridium sp. JN-1 TaxID=2483110 RepID=UPI000F0B145F|nr:QueT transporter family protein [Clostridium sp. JN-1]